MIVKKSLIQSSMGMFLFYFDVVIDGEEEDQR